MLIAVAAPAAAQQFKCDCTQIVGACDASIRVVDPRETGGSQVKSYTAKLRITSTAPSCSKVSYYLDNTPYFNILSSGNFDEDSAFGTKPVTQDSVSGVKCELCKQLGAATAQPDRSGPAASSPLAGRWMDDENSPWEISVSDGRISGTITVPGERSLPISGTVNGKNFEVTFTDYGGRNNFASCVMHSEREASCNWRATGRFYLFARTSGVWKLTKQ